MKVKVKVATQTVPVKKPQAKPVQQTSIFPKMNHVEQKRTKTIFGRMFNIVIEDVRSIFHADKKTKEDRMKYEEFMERFGK